MAVSTVSQLSGLVNVGQTRDLSLQGKATFWLPKWIWVIATVMAIWGSVSSNPVLTPFAVFVLVAVVQLLWRRGEPPVLAFACVIQWLQAAVTIFYTDFYGLSLEQANGSIDFETATWLSLFGVLALATGMRIALIGCKRSEGTPLLAEALHVDVSRAFVGYWICFVVALLAGGVSAAVPSVSQPLGAIVALKWVMVFVLGYSVLEQRAGYRFLVVVLLVELAVGVLGFFAGFKSVFFVLLVVAVTSPFALRGRRLAISLAAAAGLVFFCVVWSAVKAQYRDFVSEGTGGQTVMVSTEESANELGSLVGGLTWSNFTSGFENLVLRVGYTNLFALTLGNVPDRLPYENGRLWFEAFSHMATPRIFFPDKPALDDSERATLYTGVNFAGAEQGSSIGIGYMAESYVDFGPIGMCVPILLLGLFFGLIYRGFVIRCRLKLLGAGIVTAILVLNGYAIETSNIKILGGSVAMLLGFVAILFVFGRRAQSWLLPKGPAITGRQAGASAAFSVSRLA